MQAIADATAAIEHAESRFQGLVVRGKALLLAGRAEEAVRDLTMALHERDDAVTVYGDR